MAIRQQPESRARNVGRATMIGMDAIVPIVDETVLRNTLTNSFVGAAKEMGNNILQDYQTTTRTWDHTVHWRQVTSTSSDEVSRKVWTTDDIYRYVHDGTDIRFAVLSSDFIPKTIPAYLGSFPGRGGVIRFDFQNPRPGIIARNFTDTIVKKQEKRILRVAESHLRRAVANSGFSYP